MLQTSPGQDRSGPATLDSLTRPDRHLVTLVNRTWPSCSPSATIPAPGSWCSRAIDLDWVATELNDRPRKTPRLREADRRDGTTTVPARQARVAPPNRARTQLLEAVARIAYICT